MSKKPSRARRAFLTVAAAVGTAALTGLAACKSWVSPAEEPAEQPRSGGPLSMFFDTVSEHGELSTEQEGALVAIRERTMGDREAKRAMRKRMRAAASEIVRGGSTDSEEFDRAVAQAMEGIEERIQVGSTALKEVHALLDAKQRELVAEAMRERVAERAAQRREGERKGAFRKIATQLMLDAVQLGALDRAREAMVARRDQIRPSEQEIGDVIDAFETDEFGAELDELTSAKLAMMREHIAEAGGHVDGALAILTPDQRQLLAEIIADGEHHRQH